MRGNPTTRSASRLGAKGLLFSLVLVFALVVGAVVMDYVSARRELEALARSHAEELTGAIQLAGMNAFLAMEATEGMLLDRLVTAARMIGERVGRGQLDLGREAAREELDAIALWSENGPVSFWPDTVSYGWLVPDSAIRQLLSGRSSEFADYVSLPGGDWYRAGVRIGTRRALVIGVDAQRLLALRREIGVGTIIRQIARARDVEYIALQDTFGIIAATGNVRILSRIATDPPLLGALQSRSFLWRTAEFEGKRVFEAVRPFSLGEGQVALLRVGMSQAPLRNAQMRMVRRLVISTLILLFAGALGLAYLWTRQLASETERAYRRVRTLSSGILERMGDGVLAIDRRGRLQWANPAARRILGFTGAGEPEDLAGLAPGVTQVLQRALETGGPVEESELVCRVGNRERILAVRASVLHGDEGEQPEIAFAVFRDLTERIRLEQQLARERRLTAMGQLASGVAHEIRNPLNAISVIAQRLAREFSPQEDEEEYRSLTQTLVAETRRVGQIVQQFLEFARPPKVNRRWVDLGAVVDESVRLMEPTAEEKGIRIEKRAEDVRIFADADQLKQALVNLLQNAVQACSNGDAIRVVAEADESEIRIVVEDTGPGIPEEILPKIFDLYFTTRPDGTGIGLSLVHRIVSVHGGSIEATNREGGGARFLIRFPREEER